MKLTRYDFTVLVERTGIAFDQLQRAAALVRERTWMLQSDTGDPTDDIDEMTAVFTVAAHFLLDAGCAEAAIPNLLLLICHVQKLGRNPLKLPIAADVVTTNANAVVQIADASHVRWRIGSVNTPWTKVVGSRRRIEPDYAPRVVVAIDLGAMRDTVRGI